MGRCDYSDRDAAPDIRVLWDRTPHARKVYRCDRCGDEIAAGQVYDSLGIVEDGTFRHERKHHWADQYPSGCPAIGLRDKAELAKQFALDERLFARANPIPDTEERKL